MDTIKKYAKKYDVQLATGALAVGLGYLSKKSLKMETVNVNGVKNVLTSFSLIVLSGVAAVELIKESGGNL